MRTGVCFVTFGEFETEWYKLGNSSKCLQPVLKGLWKCLTSLFAKDASLFLTFPSLSLLITILCLYQVSAQVLCPFLHLPLCKVHIGTHWAHTNRRKYKQSVRMYSILYVCIHTVVRMCIVMYIPLNSTSIDTLRYRFLFVNNTNLNIINLIEYNNILL